MANTQDFNICSNWGLRCYDMKEVEKGVVLKCSMSRKDKKTGEYTVPLYIDVVCMFDRCEIQEDDYVKSFINVDGFFSVGEYETKSGNKVPSIAIFATKVTKSVR